MGISSRVMHYGVMTVTAATVVSAFESVGSILVIAMLIVPPATAFLLTRRLPAMLMLSVTLAALSAAVGHALAISVPAVVFGRLGFSEVQDASTAGMMAVAAGLFFFVAVLTAPQDGLVSRVLDHWRLALRIAREDLLGWLYRLEERGATPVSAAKHRTAPLSGRFLQALARWQLRQAGLVVGSDGTLRLTDRGRRQARHIVRSHRLWESYMSRHFPLPDDHLHDAAERVEHFIDADLSEQLNEELQQPAHDPHGRVIPDGDAVDRDGA
ncbi:MAG: hypothetical protein D6725_17850 [Planctomycetota bacterium]|nr:MAG: hypothetical protein D6725_17850 [Planctomycetota bacterium]